MIESPVDTVCVDERVSVDPTLVSRAVEMGIRSAATRLRPDMLHAIERAYAIARVDQNRSREASVLEQIMENDRIGRADNAPICQDTGSVWVCLEAGDETMVPADVFAGVDEAVGHAYEEGRLRMSIVRDALFDRTNTRTNTPAFCEIRVVPGRAVKLHVMLKGGGSDNASRLVMLPPSAGPEGIVAEVVQLVREKAANACPPLIIGVGVGTTFDKVASLAKHALLRPLGSPAKNEEAGLFEARILEAVNATGIGAGALGGDLTALAVHLETAPCHIAALPLAINMGCCAMRSCTFLLTDEEGILLEEPKLLDPLQSEEGSDHV